MAWPRSSSTSTVVRGASNSERGRFHTNFERTRSAWRTSSRAVPLPRGSTSKRSGGTSLAASAVSNGSCGYSRPRLLGRSLNVGPTQASRSVSNSFCSRFVGANPYQYKLPLVDLGRNAICPCRMASRQFSIEVSCSGCRRAGLMSLPGPKNSSSCMTGTFVESVVSDPRLGDDVGIVRQRHALGVDSLSEVGEVHRALEVEPVTQNALVVEFGMDSYSWLGA